MGVNERCWCNSGKKWKKCHKERENQISEPIGRVIDNIRSEMLKGYCLHPDASENTCTGKAIRAHTIQRRGGLAAIAENGHVISPKKGYEDIIKNEGEIVPRECGVRDASTFMGFCNDHDNKMFEPIEKRPLSLCVESTFLLSFRAISYEYFCKEAALRINETQQQIDKGMPFERQCDIQEYFYYKREGMKRGMEDLKKWKSDYDNAYISGSYSRFYFYAARFSGFLAFEHLENIYFQPSWWNSQPECVRKELLERTRSGCAFGGRERNSESFTNFPYMLSDLLLEMEEFKNGEK